MSVSNKLVAVVASAAVLAGGAGVAVASQSLPTTSVPAYAAAAITSPTYFVRVWADNQTYDVEVPTPTVAAALTAAGVTLGAEDRVSPAATAAASTGTIVTVQRVKTTEKKTTKAIAFSTKRVNDSSLVRGTTKVKTKGVNGVRTTLTRVVTVDGEVESSKKLSAKVTKKPVTRVLLVGTKAPVASSAASSSSSGAGINLARAAMWDRIAKCESGGNWAINTGNGYYGGLQFNAQTWLGVNGDDFARYPHQASRAEQITVANRLYAQRGLQPWGCAHAA